MADLKPLGINSPTEPKQRQLDPAADRLLVNTVGPQGGASSPLVILPVTEVTGTDLILEIRDGGPGTVFSVDGNGTVSITPSASGTHPNQWVSLFSFGEYNLELQGVSTYLSETSPEGVISAPPGSLCQVRYPAANANDGLWVKGSGVGNTGWTHLAAGTTDHGALTGLADDDHLQYLLVDGTRAMSGVLQLVDGTVGAPALTFASEPGLNTGLYRPGDGVLGVSADGVETARFQAPSGSNPQLLLPVSGASKPHLADVATGGTGFALTAGNINIQMGGSTRWNFNSVNLFAQHAGASIENQAVGGSLLLSGRADQTTTTTAGIRLRQYADLPFVGANISQKLVEAFAVVNQTGTSSFSGLIIDLTNTALGSGAQYFADFRVGSTTVAAITNGSAATTRGRFLAGNGATATPSLSFLSDPNTGFYGDGSDNLYITLAGSARWLLQNGYMYAETAAAGMRMDVLNGILDFGGRVTSGTTESVRIFNNATFSASAGTQTILLVSGTVGQSLTAAYTGLEVAVTETTTGSGAKYLFSGKSGAAGSTQVWAVNSSGQSLAAITTESAPSYSFLLDTGTGVFHPAGQAVGISSNGTEIVRATGNGSDQPQVMIRTGIDSASRPHYSFLSAVDTGMSLNGNGLTFYVDGVRTFTTNYFSGSAWPRVEIETGTFDKPSLVFEASTTTGVFSPGADIFGISTAAVERVRFTATNSTLSTHWMPAANLTYNLGAYGTRWANLIVGFVDTNTMAVNTSLGLPDGTVGSPGLQFNSDTNTGLWRIGSGQMGLSGDGLEIVRFQAPVGADPQVLVANGSSLATPAIAFASNPDTGILAPEVLAPGLPGVLFTVNGALAGGFLDEGSGVQFRTMTGTASVPALSIDQADLGFYAPTGTIAAAVSKGIEVFRWQAPASADPQFIAMMGSAGKPSITFNDGFSTAGLFQPAAGMIGFVSGATERWRLNSGTLLAMAADSSIRSNVANQSLRFSSSLTTGINPGFLFDNNSVNLTAATGTQKFISASATVAQSGTAGYTGFEIDITESSTGSGTKRLLDARVGGSTKFSVGNDGVVLAGDGALATPTYAFVSEPGLGWYRSAANTMVLATAGVAYWLYQGAAIRAGAAASNLSFTSANSTFEFVAVHSTSTTAPFTFKTSASWPFSAAAGTQKMLAIETTLNQSGTAGYTMLDLAATETATGSGVKKLIDGKVGGVSRFEVFGGAFNASSGEQSIVDLTATVTQTGLTGFSALRLDVDVTGATNFLNTFISGVENATTTFIVKTDGTVFAGNGSDTAPSYSFINDSSVGIYFDSNAELSYAHGGGARLKFAADGSIVPYGSGVSWLGDDVGATHGVGKPFHRAFVNTYYASSDGTELAPTFTFENQSGSGMWRDTSVDDDLAFSCTGVAMLRLSSAAGAVSPYLDSTYDLGTTGARWQVGYIAFLRASDGGAGSPSYAFQSETNTGLYRAGANSLGIAVGGGGRATVSTSIFRNLVTVELTPTTMGTPSTNDHRIGVDTSSGRPPFLQKANATFGNIMLGSAMYDRFHAWILPGAAGTPSSLGISLGSVGTISNPGQATTNFRTSSQRILMTSAAAAGSSSEIYSQNQTLVWRGNAAGRGGFVFHARWAPNHTLVANQRGFVGLYASTASLLNADPSSLLSMLGIGYDSADTNLQVMYNDSVGAATKVDTGISARNNTVVVDIWIYAAPNGGTVNFYITRVDGTAGTFSTTTAADLPSTTTFLAAHAWVNNGSTASSASCDLMRVVIEAPQ
jgi:hypothetical protein